MSDVMDSFGEAGKALYVALSAQYVVDDVNHALIVNACRIADNMDKLTAALEGAPLVVENHRGDSVCNPLIGEHSRLAVNLKGIFAAIGVTKLERFARSSKPRTAAGMVIDKARSKIELQQQIAELQREIDERDSMSEFLASGGFKND